MRPATKFHSIIASVTVFVMFWIITYAVPELKTFGSRYLMFSGLCALPATFGFYTLLAKGVDWLMRRRVRLRKCVFGSSFMHGTWVGSFIGHNGDKRFLVEHYEQDLDGLSMKGKSFLLNKQPHGFWNTKAISVDARLGLITLIYSFDVLGQDVPLKGISVFHIERKAIDDVPRAIDGFSHDLNDDKRIAVHEVKISDKLLSYEEALEKASKLFP